MRKKEIKIILKLIIVIIFVSALSFLLKEGSWRKKLSSTLSINTASADNPNAVVADTYSGYYDGCCSCSSGGSC